MNCYTPSQQVFIINDKVISIDWGKNDEKAIQVTAKKELDGTIIILDTKELDKIT